ncbi:MAG: hypothetical protein R2862_00865 [Thermoanaerobaculia bacterium]
MQSDPTIEVRLVSGQPAAGFVQSIAGESVWCDRPLGPGATPADPRGRRPADAAREWTPIYDGPGLLAGRTQRIRSARDPSGSFRVLHEDGETFEISGDGGTIVRLACPDVPVTNERLLGAPFAVALALRGRYLLHASALVTESGSAIALTAESGGGKSTLAAAAERSPAHGLRRIADDQLPVRLTPELAVLPHFPQPKLTPAEQYSEAHPAELPWSALVEVAVVGGLSQPRLRRMGAPEAIAILVGATVAAKLFDATLLARHFEACAVAMLDLAIYRLEVPFGLDRLDDSLEVLATLGDPDGSPG